MLVRKWRQWGTCALTVGTQNGVGTVQNSQGLPKNLNVDSPCDPATQILGISPKRLQQGHEHIFVHQHSKQHHAQ